MSFGLRFVLGLGILVSGVSEASLTRAELLKGSPVPERREFPRNEAVSPCENFHLYVCGAVESSFKIPAHRSYWSFSFTDNAERLLHAKKQYFYQLERGAEPRSARAKPIKNYYLACMNEKAARSEERGIVETEAKRILAIRSLDELAELLQSRIDAPEASFLGFTSVPNQSNPIRNDLILLANAMTLPERSYYSKPEVLADLEKFARTVFAP